MSRHEPRAPHRLRLPGEEAHRTIDPDRLQLAELLDRWLEATRGEMRVASYNSYRRIRRLHVDPALGQVLAGKARGRA